MTKSCDCSEVKQVSNGKSFECVAYVTHTIHVTYVTYVISMAYVTKVIQEADVTFGIKDLQPNGWWFLAHGHG